MVPEDFKKMLGSFGASTTVTQRGGSQFRPGALRCRLLRRVPGGLTILASSAARTSVSQAEKRGSNPWSGTYHPLLIQVQGLRRSTPENRSKSRVLRVTTVIPCSFAVAAMSASRNGAGSGT